MFLALTRRYGFKPYRMYRQHAATVMVDMPQEWMNNVFWPEFLALSKELGTYLDEVTTRVIAEAIHGDSSDATEVKQLG